MANRRRNLIVLVLVLALLAGSSYVISDKRTVLGLDLRGGTELVYQGRATPQVPEVTARGHRPRDRDHPRARRHARRRRARDLADRPRPDRGRPARRHGLRSRDRPDRDHGAALLLRLRAQRDPAEPGHPRSGGAPLQPPVDAVEAASKRQPECFQDTCTTNGPTNYLFDEDTLEPLGEPSENLRDLYLPFGGEQPPNSKVIEVPQGTVVLEEPAVDDASTADVDESELADSKFFVLKDRPSLSGDEIENPEQASDPVTNQPNVTFDFTDSGRQAFQEVTRDISLRGQDAYFAATRPARVDRRRGDRGRVLRQLRDRARRRAAVAADHQLQGEPRRDRRPHRGPDLGQLHDHRGPGPRRGPADRRAADQARPDQPEHGLGDARRAGPRPGAEGRPRGSRRRPALPDPLLPLPRPRSPGSGCSSTRSSSSP